MQCMLYGTYVKPSLLNCKSFGHEAWPTNRYNKEQYFCGKILHDLEGRVLNKIY